MEIEASPLEGVPATKIRSFSNRTKALDASDLRDFGEVVAIGPPSVIVRRPRVVEAYIGRGDIGVGFTLGADLGAA